MGKLNIWKMAVLSILLSASCVCVFGVLVNESNYTSVRCGAAWNFSSDEKSVNNLKYSCAFFDSKFARDCEKAGGEPQMCSDAAWTLGVEVLGVDTSATEGDLLSLYRKIESGLSVFRELKIFLRKLKAGKMWDVGGCYLNIDKDMGKLCSLGIIIGFLFFSLQMLFDFVTQVLGQNVHPLKIVQKNVAKIIIVAILLNSTIYDKIMNTSAGVTDKIANSILKESMGNELSVIIETAVYASAGYQRNNDGTVGKPLANKWSIGDFGKSLLHYVVSGIVFMISVVVLFIFPKLQTLLFAVAALLGPICIPFILFEPTAYVTRNWFSLLMTICFMSVIGSLAIYIGMSAGFYTDANTGAVDGNAIVMLVFGLLSIVLLVLSYPISGAIFGNAGGMAGVFSAGGIIGTSALVVGGAMAVASKGASLVSGAAGGVLKKVGLKGAGEALQKGSKAMSEYASGQWGIAKNEASRLVGRQATSDQHDHAVLGNIGKKKIF
jgi:type IV secretory pathway VirB6-like protein